MLSLEEFCHRFESREAIYIEKGALRVRVFNLKPFPKARAIEADIEEIPTPGLGVGVYCAGPARLRRRFVQQKSDRVS